MSSMSSTSATNMSATPSATSTANPAASGAAKQPRLFGLDSRFVAPIFITIILLVGQLTYGILESYALAALAIATAIAFELLLGRLLVGRWPHLASAYISGISVGILTRSPYVWPFALCSAISIMSKYVLRVRDRHIWNPSNFGISVMLLIAPWAYSTLSVQWGNNVWPMLVIWTLGAIITYHVRRIHITFTYVASFFVFAYLRTFVSGHSFLAEAAPITGPMYQLFIFFMITDPKTTVRSSKRAQAGVAFCIALVETVLRLGENIHAPYYALFIVGPVANLIEIYLMPRGRDGAPAAIATPAPEQVQKL